jgi:hypothetical protein
LRRKGIPGAVGGGREVEGLSRERESKSKREREKEYTDEEGFHRSKFSCYIPEINSIFWSFIAHINI